MNDTNVYEWRRQNVRGRGGEKQLYGYTKMVILLFTPLPH